jgi:tRNA G18 (ribose-2'-O)-methylase SpoU
MDRAETVRIEMAGGFDSLNVATTSGIVLHHLVATACGARRP